MNILKNFILLTCMTFIFSNVAMEEYIYDVEIKGISMIAGNVGKCNLKIEQYENNEYEMNITTQTTNLAKFLYPYVDQIKLKLNESELNICSKKIHKVSESS